MADPRVGGFVVVIDAGPPFFRKPTWAYGPFPTVTDAESWVARAAERWQAAVGGWDHRVVPHGSQGAIRVEDPDGPARRLG